MQGMPHQQGHDVLAASKIDPSATDEALLKLATDENRVIITEDKDFGELVFLQGMSHPCIVRFVGMQVHEKVTAMRELIDNHADSMLDGSLIVVTQNRIRVRAVEN